MYRITPNALRDSGAKKKMPLNRLIRAARDAQPRNVRADTLPTLGMLRDALLSGLEPAELEAATGPRRLRTLIERAADRIG